MHGYDVVTSDDQKIGTVMDVRDDCLIVEHGHVFKGQHAIPKTFVHVDDTEHVVRATVTKDVFSNSPKLSGDWDCDEINRYYGLTTDDFVTDPDPEGMETTTNADTTRERVAIREGLSDREEMPKVRERQANALDPAGDTANLSSKH
jgi:hypothetical protein